MSKIISQPSNDAYRANWDEIWGKKISPCLKCEGLGITEDPQHGHAFRCAECDGKGWVNDRR